MKSPEHLARYFTEAADTANIERLRGAIDAGFPSNFTDPRTGWTLLHHAAAAKSWPLLDFALARECNPLIRDKWGRYPSWVSNDPMVGDGRTDIRMWEILRRREEEAAARQNIEFDPLPPEDAPPAPGW